MTLAGLGLAGVVFLLAYGLTAWLATPRAGFAPLDFPNDRSLHQTPTPRTGGVAIVVSALAGAGLGVVPAWREVLGWDVTGAETGVFLWAGGLALVIAAVSLWDDVRGLLPGLRFAVHALAAAGAVRGGGLIVNAIPVPLLGSVSSGWLAVPLYTILVLWLRKFFGGAGGIVEGAVVLGAGALVYVALTGGGVILSVWALLMTIFWVIWTTNLYNFMDGMDGLAGGMTVIGYGFLSLIAWQQGLTMLAGWLLLIVAAAAGFLLHNLPPARIFMGDVGSVPLGFLTGVFAAYGVHAGHFDLWVPVLIFSPFIVDATVTLISRLLRGEKVWRPHRQHFYQRLVLAGWGHRKTVIAEYSLMLACGTSALVYARVGEGARLAILLGWSVTYLSLAWGVRRVESQANGRQETR